MRDLGIIPLNENKEVKNENKKGAINAYIFTMLGTAIFGIGMGLLIDERSDIILNFTKSLLTEFKYKNLKSATSKHIHINTVVWAVQRGTWLSGGIPLPYDTVRDNIGKYLLEKNINIISLNTAQNIASLFVAKSTWLGTIAWRFGKYTPVMGLLAGLTIGFAVIWTIRKYTERKVKNLNDSIDLLKKEIRQLIIQQAKMEQYLLLEPLEDTPDEYICPITKMLINDPVVIDRHPYEREAIKQWYLRKKICPLNPSQTLQNPDFILTDRALQLKIKEYIKLNSLKRCYEEFVSQISLENSSKKEAQNGKAVKRSYYDIALSTAVWIGRISTSPIRIYTPSFRPGPFG